MWGNMPEGGVEHLMGDVEGVEWWDFFYICVEDNGYTGCHRRNGPNFGRVFLMLNYTDITQNTYIQS